LLQTARRTSCSSWARGSSPSASLDLASSTLSGEVGHRRVNLLLLRDEDFQPDGTALLSGRREQHAREVLRAQAGDALRAGKLGGLVGNGVVIESPSGTLR